MGSLYPLYIASVFSVIIPFSAGISTIKRQKSDLRLLLVLFGFATIVELYTFHQALHHLPLHWVHHIYAPVEYAFYAWIFSLWHEDRVFKKAIRLSIVVFMAICILDIANLKGLNGLNGFTASVACLFYVAMSAYTIFRIMKGDEGAISKDFRFWIASALLIYSAGSLIYFAFSSYVFSVTIWSIHSALNIVANVLYGMGFLCQYRHPVLSGA
jgi:hypothetical protein